MRKHSCDHSYNVRNINVIMTLKKNYLLHGKNLGEQYPPNRHYAERRRKSGSEEQYQHQPGSDRF